MKIKYFILFLSTVLLFSCTQKQDDSNNLRVSIEELPADFMFMQRAYPTGEIKTDAYKKALQWKKDRSRNASGFSEFIGPLNIGGRVTDIEIPIDDADTYYVGAASGGVFKTTDAGVSWDPIFDEQEMLSIGDITISKNDTELIWVGTGEVNAGGGSLAYDGDGIYKSEDGGDTWEVKGLPDVGSISKIVLDPNDDDIVLVGGMGPLFRNDSNRGVYKSIDGGDTWEQKLFVSDSTGIIDLAIHPTNGNIVYAASWERIRRPQYRQYGGETSGIYRSLDGGETWTELTNGLPSLPSEKGRISLDISQSNPDVLYTRYADATGNVQGIYRTNNGGDSWFAVNSSSINQVSFHWWFRGIVIDPTNENTIYNVDFVVQKSTDGGQTWNSSFAGVHVDQHALAFNPNVPGQVLLGNDGGVYRSSNDGANWEKFENLPITQFYRIFAHSEDFIFGGSQDNSTIRSINGGNPNVDWDIVYIGDGFQPLVDPNNPDIVYALYQRGNIGKSTNGGNSFVPATNGISGADRKNWDTPLVFDPQDSQILYTGTQRVYKSINGAANWSPISPDLTNGDGGGNLTFGTIISIDVSEIDSNLIYVGTDDGNVWRTDDGGSNWENLSATLPNRWVTKVLSHPENIDEVYVSFSGYRYGENEGHVYFSDDRGSTWQDITDNLPDIPVNDLVYGGSFVRGLFVATDVGVMVKYSGSGSWEPFMINLPSVPVTDLFIDKPFEDFLYVGTYGRSMYKGYLVDIGFDSFNTATFSLYPNPATDEVEIISKLEGPLDYLVYSINGNLVLDNQIVTSERKIDVSNLPSGLYFVTVSTQDGISSTQKLIVQ